MTTEAIEVSQLTQNEPSMGYAEIQSVSAMALEVARESFYRQLEEVTKVDKANHAEFAVQMGHLRRATDAMRLATTALATAMESESAMLQSTTHLAGNEMDLAREKGDAALGHLLTASTSLNSFSDRANTAQMMAAYAAMSERSGWGRSGANHGFTAFVEGIKDFASNVVRFTSGLRARLVTAFNASAERGARNQAVLVLAAATVKTKLVMFARKVDDAFLSAGQSIDNRLSDAVDAGAKGLAAAENKMMSAMESLDNGLATALDIGQRRLEAGRVHATDLIAKSQSWVQSGVVQAKVQAATIKGVMTDAGSAVKGSYDKNHFQAVSDMKATLEAAAARKQSDFTDVHSAVLSEMGFDVTVRPGSLGWYKAEWALNGVEGTAIRPTEESARAFAVADAWSCAVSRACRDTGADPLKLSPEAQIGTVMEMNERTKDAMRDGLRHFSVAG